MNTENKKDILRIEVPKARTVTATSKGKTLRRRLKFDGSPEAVPLFPYEIPSRLSELSLLDFSAQPLEGATEEDLDVLEFERLKSIIKNSIGSDKSLLELNQEDFYKALHFIVEENGKIIPKYSVLKELFKSINALESDNTFFVACQDKQKVSGMVAGMEYPYDGLLINDKLPL